MRKKVSSALAVFAMVLGLTASTAFAWSYSLSGSGQCQPDGSFKITWVINNSEEEDLVVQKSNRASVPVGTTVPANESASFDETVSGTDAPASYKLKVKANWPGSDNNNVKEKSTVVIKTDCEQPTPVVPTPVGGRGAGEVQPAAAQAQAQPQVVAPVGAVNAGMGGASEINPVAVAGLVSSLSLAGLGLGLRRFHKA